MPRSSSRSYMSRGSIAVARSSTFSDGEDQNASMPTRRCRRSGTDIRSALGTRSVAVARASTAASPPMRRNSSRMTGPYSSQWPSASMIGWLRRERSFRAYTTLRLHVISITTQVIDLLTTRAEDAAGGTMGMLRVAFAGTFSATLEPTVRARLGMPCDVILADETGIVSQLSDVDVLITLGFTRETGAAAKRLKLVQVPGAGLDRIDRAALPAGALLANVYGHEIGIAEYVLGAMLTLTRGFARLDAALRRGAWESQWAVGSSPPAPWPELAGKTLGILGYGRIGQALARRARAFDMEVCAIRREVTRSDSEGLAFLGGPAGRARRGRAARRLSGRHALAHRGPPAVFSASGSFE